MELGYATQTCTATERWRSVLCEYIILFSVVTYSLIGFHIVSCENSLVISAHKRMADLVQVVVYVYELGPNGDVKVDKIEFSKTSDPAATQ